MTGVQTCALPIYLIVAQDEEVVIEHHPEDWIAFVLFWALAIIVFLQFFTRYVMNDSLSWTEEIARYGLMSLAFIGGAVVTRKRAHIAVELVSNLMGPGPVRSALLAASLSCSAFSCCSRGSPWSVWCVRNSCADATSNTSWRLARLACRMP